MRNRNYQHTHWIWELSRLIGHWIYPMISWFSKCLLYLTISQLKLEQIKSYLCVIKKIEFLVFNDEITDGYLKCFHFVCRLHRYGNSPTIKWCWSMLLNLINVGRSQGEKRNKKTLFCHAFSAYVISLYFNDRLFIFCSHKMNFLNYSAFWLARAFKDVRIIEPNRKCHRIDKMWEKSHWFFF